MCTCSFSFVNGYFKVKSYLLYASNDMMFFKVITITLMTVCAADDQLLFSELLSEPEEASPALASKRHILFPMMYKYTKMDGYTTPASKSRSVRSAKPNVLFRKLQYAPLHHVTRNYDNPTPTLSRVHVTEIYPDKKSRHSSKLHLEPRTESTDKKCHASGYNKKTKSSASRSPGHNAVYRIISEPSPKEKQVTNNYEKPIGINVDLKSLISTTPTESPLVGLTSDYKNMPLTLSNDHFVLNPNSLETDLPVRDQSKRYSSHPKYHRLHLNIARVYSPRQVPPKPPAYARAYPEHFDRPPKPPVYRSQAYQDQSKNTMLFPVKHHKKGNYRVHPSISHF